MFNFERLFTRVHQKTLVRILTFTVASAWPASSSADYQEECLSEGCNNEEVDELYDSYQEECLNEGCSNEEKIELAGGPQFVNQMLSEFRRRGFKVAEEGNNCVATGTIAKCRLFLLTCQDWYQCPTGSDSCEGEFACPGGNTSSSWYVCGGCIGFDW
jgi:hypothetical protein